MIRIFTDTVKNFISEWLVLYDITEFFFFEFEYF